ncbi:MAG TPA: hypothetical protein PKC20_07530, partial [Burkholderiaceae bacterium]|nr:hypothetical protein [Burkholderiaceae bacterium]
MSPPVPFRLHVPDDAIADLHARLARTRLPEWLKARFELQDQQPTDDAVAFIADRVEGNLIAAFQEVQKLA